MSTADRQQPAPTARELFASQEPITNTRDRITSTALNFFYEHGFHAVGLDRIIAAVGVTKTTFYNHFDSKDDLMVAAIEMRDRWESEAFVNTMKRFEDGTPRGSILACFDVLDLWFTAPEYTGCLFITACAEFPSQHDPVHKAALCHVNKTTKLLKDLCHASGAREPDVLAHELELLIAGALVIRQMKDDHHTARAAKAAASKLLDTHGVPTKSTPKT